MEYPSTYLLKCTPDDLKKLSILAANEGISMAEWIRNAIRDAWDDEVNILEQEMT